MGRDGGNAAARPTSLMDIFKQALPLYLKYGMTYEQYWDGDTSAHKAYREADKLRKREANQIAWLQGAYFYEALMDAAPAIKAFAKGRAKPYRSEPYDMDTEEKERREERERRKRYKNIREKVAIFADAFNKKYESDTTPERKEETIDDG